MPLKITHAIATEIRSRALPTARRGRGDAVRALAVEFQLAIETIRRIRSGRTWKREFPRATVTPAIVADILANPDLMLKVLAERHGISVSTVSTIRTGLRCYVSGYGKPQSALPKWSPLARARAAA